MDAASYCPQGSTEPTTVTEGYYTTTGDVCTPNHNLRIAGGGSAGRLEVWHSGVWGTVCDDSFTDVEAAAACRALCYESGSSLGNSVPGGTGTIWLDDVACPDTATPFFDCTHRGFGRHNCNHAEDVGISCTAPATVRIAQEVRATTTGKMKSLTPHLLSALSSWFRVCRWR